MDTWLRQSSSSKLIVCDVFDTNSDNNIQDHIISDFRCLTLTLQQHLKHDHASVEILSNDVNSYFDYFQSRSDSRVNIVQQ